ncbi:uncharacterized protein LOC131659068 [Vicia villosa]|uniref:uncharacterized protein LOC131659068 n=1 Tax=Vicia villosa TaxID=3911 RepID=UPI00273AE657|nr:uncharacterized protein LOC131659068 [Vicia villosa]
MTEMRRFLVDRESTENVNVEQAEAELQSIPNNVMDEFNPNEIVRYPGLRKQINEYAPDIQDQKPGRAEHFGFEVFTKSGYKDWKHASQGLKDHVGSHNSLHNSCVKHYDDYNNQRQSVASKFARATKESEELYKIRLTYSVDCSRYLIAQGMAFRGHDESSISLNKGNFREMVNWVKAKDEQVSDAFNRGGKNCTMISSDIQKELAMCCAHEVTKEIMEELGDIQFYVLIDEPRDISIKEKMEVMLRFVNDKGHIVERFIALHHVKDTTSEALKDALYGILDKYTLSISRIRGQGYDGASNMRGEFNGLQRKILDENPYAFYVHCYAHRLKLVVVSVASSCSSIHDFFEYISLIVNTTSASCKKRDALTEAQHQDILNQLERGEISKGRGLHQSSSLTRPGNTRWGSHHTTLLRLDQIWPSVLKLFGITNELSNVLQRKDLNIVNAMELVDVVKARLATMRDSGWDNLFADVQ